MGVGVDLGVGVGVLVAVGVGVALGWGVGVGNASVVVQAVKRSKARLTKILFRLVTCYSRTTKSSP